MSRFSTPIEIRIVSPGGGGGLPSWVPPVGTFFGVGNNTMSSVDPCPANNCSYNSGSEGQQAVFDDWNSGAYADGAGPLGTYIMWGGGHGGYGGNEVYGFDFNTLLWSRLRDPFTGVNADWSNYDSQGNYADGSPAVPHTYDTLHWIPGPAFGNTKGAFLTLNQVGLTRGGQPGTNWAHFFNLDNAIWTTSTNTGSFPGTPHACSAYDPVRNVVWTLSQTVRSNITKMDIATRTYSVVNFSSGTFLSSTSTMTGGWSSTHNVAIFWASTHGLFVFNPANNQFVLATTSGTPPPSAASMSWCPHPSVQKFYCYSGGGATSIRTLTPPVNPMTGTWIWGTENFTAHNGAPAPAQGFPNPPFNRLRWAEALKCFVWAGHRTGLVTVFRPALAS